MIQLESTLLEWSVHIRRAVVSKKKSLLRLTVGVVSPVERSSYFLSAETWRVPCVSYCVIVNPNIRIFYKHLNTEALL